MLQQIKIVPAGAIFIQALPLFLPEHFTQEYLGLFP
jgi:hypothetical protein